MMDDWGKNCQWKTRLGNSAKDGWWIEIQSGVRNLRADQQSFWFYVFNLSTQQLPAMYFLCHHALWTFLGD